MNVHLLVNELYEYQNVRCNGKKKYRITSNLRRIFSRIFSN